MDPNRTGALLRPSNRPETGVDENQFGVFQGLAKSTEYRDLVGGSVPGSAVNNGDEEAELGNRLKDYFEAHSPSFKASLLILDAARSVQRSRFAGY
jgi:hypothetical protein